MTVLDEIRAEKLRQNTERGGDERADMLIPVEWARLARREIEHAEEAAVEGWICHWREDMVRVAALAAAAVESYDRKAGRRTGRTR